MVVVNAPEKVCMCVKKHCWCTSYMVETLLRKQQSVVAPRVWQFYLCIKFTKALYFLFEKLFYEAGLRFKIAGYLMPYGRVIYIM